MAAVKGSKASGRGTVVAICVDESPQCEEAVNYYLQHLVKPTHNVVLLHAIELPDNEHARQQYLSPNALAEMWKEETKKADKIEEKYVQIFKKSEINEVSSRKEGGLKAGSVLCQTAEQEGSDLLIMGTRGMGTIRRTIMGSVSDYVIHHAKCPVLVCRKAKDVTDVKGAQ